MLSPENLLDSPASSSRENGGSFAILDEPGTSKSSKPYKKLPGIIDARLRELSYSSSNTLHSCPRKFQLYRLRSQGTKAGLQEEISHAFGHSVGLGTQLIFQNRFSLGEIFWQMFLFWPDKIPLLAEDTPAGKGFFAACVCIRKLYAARQSGFLADWEILIYENKPAIEFSFEILIPGGFRYRGFVDAVLKNKRTGAIGVLERKTTKARTVDEAAFKNSSQALGYSIVLDHLFPELSSYEVIYLAYSSITQEEFLFQFSKSFAERAEWIQNLVFDVEDIQKYDESGVYPRRGENCFSFFRQCQFFQVCTLSVERLAKEYVEEEHADTTQYQISVSLEDLIQSQIQKVGV